jgi:hypothetical protein
VYPINELWNLAPTDRQFNQHVQRDRVPSHDLLVAAVPRLELAYEHYMHSSVLGDALRQDVTARFTPPKVLLTRVVIATVVADFLNRAAEARYLPLHGDQVTRQVYDKLVEEAREARTPPKRNWPLSSDLQEVVDALIAAYGLNDNAVRAL